MVSEQIPPEFQPLVRASTSRLSAEFAGIFSAETVHRFLGESLNQLLEIATVREFVPLFAERFARDRLWSLARSQGKIATKEPVVLFLCVQNAGRSQMAAAWLDHMAGGHVRVMSGGSAPDGNLNTMAVAAMREVGIDLATQFPKPWTDEVVRAADVVVTMGCGDACPIYPGKRYEDWEVADPAEADMDGVRAIRDDIEARVRQLLATLAVMRASQAAGG